MIISNYIKGQLEDIVYNYKKYFGQTFGTAITFTVLCCISSALLLRFSDFDKLVTAKQISSFSYYFHRYSKGETYSIVDLTKTFFVFFIAFFSLGISRQPFSETDNIQLSFSKIKSKIKIKDIISLIGILCLASIIDIGLTKLDNLLETGTFKKETVIYLHDWLFNLRVYIPLILFSLTLRYLTNTDKTKLTIKRILFLYISLWVFNEFAFEISLWVRSHLFNLILLPVEDPDKFYLFETILSIPLIAFYFLGFHSAMTTSLKLTENKAVD